MDRAALADSPAAALSQQPQPLRLGTQTFAHGIGTHANSVITYLLPEGYPRFRATAGPDTGALEQKGSETSLALFVDCVNGKAESVASRLGTKASPHRGGHHQG